MSRRNTAWPPWPPRSTMRSRSARHATRVLGNGRLPSCAWLLKRPQVCRRQVRVRSLRGYIRIPRQLDISDHQRLQMCRTAMEAAERDDERRLVLDACTRVANSQSLAFVASHLDTPGLKDSACAATVSIAERLVSAEPKTVAEAVQRSCRDQDAELTRRAKEVLQRPKVPSAPRNNTSPTGTPVHLRGKP